MKSLSRRCRRAMKGFANEVSDLVTKIDETNRLLYGCIIRNELPEEISRLQEQIVAYKCRLNQISSELPYPSKDIKCQH